MDFGEIIKFLMNKKIKLYKINEFKIGTDIKGFYICINKNINKAINGNMYIDIQLKDVSGLIKGKIWENVEFYNKKFNIGDIVSIKGSVTEYNNVIGITINNIKKANKALYKRYGFNINNVYNKTKIPLSKLWISVNKIINDISNIYIKKLLCAIYMENKPIIAKLPFFNNSESPIIGGFIEKKNRLSKIACEINKQYNLHDPELLIAGILLLEFGKVKIIDDIIKNNNYKSDDIISLNIIEWEFIKSYIDNINQFPKNISMKLEYIIISFFNKEINKVKSLKLEEAIIINYLYYMDNQFNRNIENNNQNMLDTLSILANHYGTLLNV